MRYSVSGSLYGTWQFDRFETIAAAVAHTDKLRELGVIPVHIKRDGKLIKTTAELQRLLNEEASSGAD